MIGDAYGKNECAYMIILLKKYPVFAVLLPVFILIHIEAEYHNLITYRFVTKEILILFIVPVIVYAACFIFLRSIPKANILSLTVLIIFFFGGEFIDWLRSSFPNYFFQRYTFIIPFITVLVFLLSLYLKKRSIKFEKVNLYFNLAFILFIIADLVNISLRKTVPENSSVNRLSNYDSCQNCRRPDIYYLVFDSYAGTSSLRSEFNYDNSELENYLSKNDFRIISDSKSNYNLTPFSIGSTFNMEYLDDIDSGKRYFLKDYLPAVKKVYTNKLFPIMEKRGYQVFNQGMFNVESHPGSVPLFDAWEIKLIYQQHNFVRKIYNEIGWQFPAWLQINLGREPDYAEQRDAYDKKAIEMLYDVIKKPSVKPKFVYNHLFLPHSPYSFDSSGNKIKVDYHLSVEADKQAYISQLIYVNKLMRSVIDAIKKESKNPPVIIVQSDHGYRFFNASKAQLEFINLSAFYFPSKNYSMLTDSVSNVNTFRIVLNTIFEEHWPILENKHFFIKYK